MSKHSHYDVILSPIITEKSTLVLEVSNQVIFKVARTATKPQIKQAIESLFKVKVKAVNTLVRKGKLKSFRGIRALQSDTKKAIVTLEPGHSIDISSGI
jgi:large subunit ribosomal protein L23